MKAKRRPDASAARKQTDPMNVDFLPMSQRTEMPQKASRGFTLIELMITVAIVAILAAVAYPSYTSYIVRSNRSAAQGYLLELSNLQQRRLLDARSYASDLAGLNVTSASVPPNVSPNYTIATATRDTGSALPGFEVTATPKGSQSTRDSACGKLTINETGAKSAAGGGTSCW
jgi:type IV pilus assembly protein PilE